MANSIDAQIKAQGVAQVIAILNPNPTRAPDTQPSAALAAAIPVVASQTQAVPQKLVMELSKHFRLPETSQDSALAMSTNMTRAKSRGVNWFERASTTSDPTPAARYFPNLGVMLGTVDKTGLTALRQHSGVSEVVAPPILRPIRPVKIKPAPGAGAAAATPAPTWGIKRMRADELHKAGIDGTGIIVGHLDTGADGNHPALKKAFHKFAEFDLFGFEVKPAPAPHDTDEHGTHTAGTIAGRTASGRRIGVAPGAKLASAIVIEGGNAIARVLGGLDWIVGLGARVLSMSLGFPGFDSQFLPLTQLLRNRSVLTVFAVGNEGPGTSRSPGNYDEALSVGAMNDSDQVADFSSSDQFSGYRVPDLVAPGVDVISAKPGGGYQMMSGSSMATPHVAGLAALLMQAVPSATIDEVELAIFSSCGTLSGEPEARQGKGVPDAVQALSLLRGDVAPTAADAGPAVPPVAAPAEKPARRRKRAAARPKKAAKKKGVAARKKKRAAKKKGVAAKKKKRAAKKKGTKRR